MIKNRKNVEIKNKFINHLLIKGKKSKSEKIVLKSFKTLQTKSKKSSKKLLQLALVFNTPVFKTNTITQKKKKKKKEKTKIIPAFIYKRSSRVSFGIRFIVTTAKKNRNHHFFEKLPNEILLSSQNKSNAIERKKETQKQVFLNRHLFKYYRWH
jgi:small subunit ribosomal protein S7